jgi:tetratricopeptide (TPR) repeat protein
MKTTFLLLFTSMLFFSCLTWDSPISQDKKASFLYNQLYEQYQVALDYINLEKMKQITKDLEWVYSLDPSRKDQVLTLISNINNNIKLIKANKLKRAQGFVKQKDYLNAAIEYQTIINFEPGNKEAADFFKTYKLQLDDLVGKNKVDAKKSIDEGNYIKAEKIIVRLKTIRPNDSDLTSLSRAIEKLKFTQRDEYIKSAKKRYNEGKFDQAVYNARLALNIDPKSNEAQKIIDDSNKNIKKQTVVKKTNDTVKDKPKETDKQKGEADTYYDNALEYLNNKQYAVAKQEIQKCLIMTDDQKALDLSAKIDAEIKKQVDVLMGDAVLNYNSQKYEDALKLFNQILDIDTNNDAAMDYKSRIEKRLKALDL